MFNLGVVEGELKELKWQEGRERVLYSNPAIITAGQEIRIIYLPPNSSFSLDARKTIVVVIHGNLVEPSLAAVRSGVYRNLNLRTGSSEAILLVAKIIDEREFDFQKPPEINGMALQWKSAGEVWPALKGRNMHFTYPILKLEDPMQKRFYRVKFWHAGPNVQMGIHKHSNEPGMQEVHVQLAGSGVMQKFSRDDYDSLFEEVPQFPGQTHEPFWDKDGNYSFHQYEAGPEGTLFAAIESAPRVG